MLINGNYILEFFLKHEQSFADSFNAFMKRRSSEIGRQFHSFSLDGQDRDAGADYVLTDANRFAIVEFKYSEKDLVSEKQKPRRLNLCKELANNKRMLNFHDRCHFISWANGPEMAVRTNIYRKEICNKKIFGDHCGLTMCSPESDSNISAREFVDNFFHNTARASLCLRDFETYIAWVLEQASGSTRSTLELLTFNPNSIDLVLVRLDSISAAQNWVREHYPPSSFSYP